MQIFAVAFDLRDTYRFIVYVIYRIFSCVPIKVFVIENIRVLRWLERLVSYEVRGTVGVVLHECSLLLIFLIIICIIVTSEFKGKKSRKCPRKKAIVTNY